MKLVKGWALVTALEDSELFHDNLAEALVHPKFEGLELEIQFSTNTEDRLMPNDDSSGSKYVNVRVTRYSALIIGYKVGSH
jgi:hypothetical protein